MKYLIVYGFLFLFSSCVCSTEYVESSNAEIDKNSEHNLRCYIREGDFKDDPDLLEIEFDFCSYESHVIRCLDKKLIDSSLIIIPKFVGSSIELKLKDEYAKVFHYSTPDLKKLWQTSKELKVSVKYSVDSLGTILNREFYHTLTKKKICRKHLVLH